MELHKFSGFSKAVLSFFQELSANNEKAWFEAHKDTYRQQVLAPSQDFVAAMGERLKSLSPYIVADTRTNGAGSIFRIYRDTRFSKDKTPYKTFLGIFFWEGNRKKMENPGFYFQLEADKLMLFAGMHVFPRPVLETFRDSVVDPTHGSELRQAVAQVTASSHYKIGQQHYKRFPRGYDSTHDNSEYLLYNGLYASTESAIPQELYSAELIEFCMQRFVDMYPIHRWVTNLVARTYSD